MMAQDRGCCRSLLFSVHPHRTTLAYMPNTADLGLFVLESQDRGPGRGQPPYLYGPIWLTAHEGWRIVLVAPDGRKPTNGNRRSGHPARP